MLCHFYRPAQGQKGYDPLLDMLVCVITNFVTEDEPAEGLTFRWGSGFLDWRASLSVAMQPLN
jgi:hypothetical protein